MPIYLFMQCQCLPTVCTEAGTWNRETNKHQKEASVECAVAQVVCFENRRMFMLYWKFDWKTSAFQRTTKIKLLIER